MVFPTHTKKKGNQYSRTIKTYASILGMLKVLNNITLEIKTLNTQLILHSALKELDVNNYKPSHLFD